MEDFESDIASKPSSIEGWTKEEKFYLLQALKVFQSYDIERIHEYISTKTPEQIVLAVNHYKKIATRHPIFQKQVSKRKKYCKPRVPLTSWAKVLTDNFTLDELKTETSTAVRMIAELEISPDPVRVENFDFTRIYHTIANALEGKLIVPDKISIAVLNKCIVETALSSKAFIKSSSYKHIINSIDLTDKEVHAFPKPTENEELAVLRHLASQKNYNPLGVPENYLKPTEIQSLPSNSTDPELDNI